MIEVNEKINISKPHNLRLTFSVHSQWSSSQKYNSLVAIYIIFSCHFQLESVEVMILTMTLQCITTLQEI